MEKPDEKRGLKELIKFLNGEKGKPLVENAIRMLYGQNNVSDKINSDTNEIKIDSFDKFFDIEYEIIKAILNPDFKDKLENSKIISDFLNAKSELENLKNNNQMKDELSSLIIPSIDMGIILNNLATNCKADQNELIDSGDQNQKESIEFISICRIINRLIDNEYNYDVNKHCEAFSYEGNKEKRKKLRMVSMFIRIFDLGFYKIFWKYVAKTPNIESFIDKLNNTNTKFKNEECKKLQERFLKYKEVRGEILKKMATTIIENQELRPVYIVKLTIGEDGALSSIKKIYQKSEQDYDRIANKETPFSFWKIVLLTAIVIALGFTGFFGSNAYFAFIAVVTNPLSIIIAIVALVVLSILLLVAHKTGAFKVGKLFCCGKYENDSWFYLRQGKEHKNRPEINTNNLGVEKTNSKSENLLN